MHTARAEHILYAGVSVIPSHCWFVSQAERESYLRATNPGAIWKDLNDAASHAEAHAVRSNDGDGGGGGSSSGGSGLVGLVQRLKTLPPAKVRRSVQHAP